MLFVGRVKPGRLVTTGFGPRHMDVDLAPAQHDNHAEHAAADDHQPAAQLRSTDDAAIIVSSIRHSGR